MRLALINTPRTGNTWLRELLASAYDLQRFAVQSPDALGWDELPERAILQLHWHHEPSFRSLLKQYGFKPIVLARHPLDVLISILNFVGRDDTSRNWLLGEGGNEDAIKLHKPLDPEFRRYAVSRRAQVLLSVSAEWWVDRQAIRVRYENMVARPGSQLRRIVKRLDVAPLRDLAEVVAEMSTKRMRMWAPEYMVHIWQGKPDLWKKLLPAKLAHRICQAHAAVLDTLKYKCDPDESLKPKQATENWHELVVRNLDRDVQSLWGELEQAKAKANEILTSRDHVHHQLEEAAQTRDDLQTRLSWVAEDQSRAQEELKQARERVAKADRRVRLEMYLQQSLAASSEAYSQLEVKFKEASERFAQELDRANETCSGLQHERDALGHQLGELAAEAEQEKARLTEALEQQSRTQQHLDQVIAEFQQERSTLQAEFQQERSALQKDAAEATHFANTMDRERARLCQRLCTARREGAEEVARLNEQLQELHAAAAAYQEEISRLHSVIGQVRADAQQSRTDCEQQAAALAELRQGTGPRSLQIGLALARHLHEIHLSLYPGQEQIPSPSGAAVDQVAQRSETTHKERIRPMKFIQLALKILLLPIWWPLWQVSRLIGRPFWHKMKNSFFSDPRMVQVDLRLNHLVVTIDKLMATCQTTQQKVEAVFAGVHTVLGEMRQRLNMIETSINDSLTVSRTSDQLMLAMLQQNLGAETSYAGISAED